ncbi:hypothetical protein AAC387_Pa03g1865 [Persea americana]
MVFLDAAFKAKDGITSSGFVMLSNGIVVDAGAIQGPEVASPKEAKVRAILIALKKARKNGFDKVCVLIDAKEVVHVLKGDRNWSISPIIVDIKALATFFGYVVF